MAEFTFDATKIEVEERGDFELIPAGNHQMEVIDSEIYKSDTGSVGLKFQCRITGESFNNRRIFNYINIVKKDGTENEIGHKQIAQLCNAVGIESFSDTVELHDKPFTGYIKHEDGQNGKQERVVGFNPPKVTPVKANDGGDTPPF